MRAANLLAEKAVNVRSEARSAYQAYHSNYDIARHYRNSVVPLRTKIEEESLLTYNGMLTNTFELLADSREKSIRTCSPSMPNATSGSRKPASLPPSMAVARLRQGQKQKLPPLVAAVADIEKGNGHVQ